MPEIANSKEGTVSASRSVSRVRAAKQRRPDVAKDPIGREGWLTAARAALIRDGIAGVQVGKLARRLKVTRGGFYWFFDSRQELLDALLADWQRTNTEAFGAVLRQCGSKGMDEFHAVVDIWVNEEGYSPAWDAAIRDWARVSAKVAKAVRRTDDVRIGILKQIFVDMGCGEDEAFVRARICYFHQVGYYTLGVRESRELRLKYLPMYVRFLTGRDG
ncbi:MAG TPA: TetR/AcrR family transcriptional regulator [Steroidobacteraceae bacterium]|nr:TetR/AcrR family transcriptional regulator [Steroidobacteraceae bacterium]